MKRRTWFILAVIALALAGAHPSSARHRRKIARGHPPLGLAQQRPAVVPNQWVVKFAPGTSQLTRAQLHAMAGAELVSTVPELGIQTVQLPGTRAAAVYARSRNVLWMEPARLRYPLALNPPNDPAYNNIDTNLPSDPAQGTWYKWDSHVIQCVSGWSIWPGRYYTAADRANPGVRIAVIDTGVDYGHPDFINSGGTSSRVSNGGQLDRPLDVSIINGAVTPDAWDVYGHGTHVTGIAAAATNNGTGTTGNGYSATVLSLRVADANGNANETDLAQAIVYAADHGTLICNISLGGYGYSQAEQDAVNYAWGKGTLVIAAAGNDGTNTSPNYPAALTRVLAVSATARTDVLATYSNYGDYIGIAAPGGDFDFDIGWFLGVYSTMPTYFVPLNDPNIEGASENYDYLMGTSMASPEVVGLAALYAGSKGYTQQTPGVTVKIWQALQRGADNVAGGDGGWDPDYGFGRISVFGTMNLAVNPNPRGATSGSVVGQVRYKDTPVANAVVQLVPAGGGAARSASSRADGGYRVVGIPVGSYNATATVFGESQTIASVQVVPGADTPGIDFNVGTTPPASPTNLHAVAGNAQVSLSWTGSAGATGYNVKRATVSGGPYATIASNIGVVTYTDQAVVNGTTYYYVVSALNSAGESANSAQASATPLAPQPPPAPTNVKAVAGNAQVTISWTASAGAASYTVQRATVSGGPYATVPGGSGIAATSFVDKGLTNGTTYYYVVVAVNAAGNSPNSAQVSATPALPPPAAPTNVTAVAGNAQVTISWTASAGAASYTVQRSTVSGGPYATVPGGSGIAATSFVDKGLTNGTTYYYVVIAVNAAGSSPNSAQVSATPMLAPPAAPTNVTAAAGNAQVTLSWTASAGATSYSVQRATVSGGPYATVPGGSGIAGTSFVDGGLTNGTTYYYVVIAVNAAGNSPKSAQVSATPTAGGAAPAPPTGLVARGQVGDVIVGWTQSASAGVTQNRVYRGTVNGGPYVLIATVNATSPAGSYIDRTAVKGTTYYYVATAVTGGGIESGYSNQASAAAQ